MSNYGISHSLPSWLDNRAAGVLLHPSSLPGAKVLVLSVMKLGYLLIFLKVQALAIGKLARLVRLDLGIHLIRYFVPVLVIHISLIGVHWLILVYFIRRIYLDCKT